MSKRSERREAERLSRKLAFKQRNQSPAQSAAAMSPADSEQPAKASDCQAANSTNNTADLLANAQAFFGTKPEPEPEPTPKKPTSEAQLNANRANAQHSTGATSSEGKAKSSMNALKHGLTGKIVLLPLENAAAYQKSLEDRVAIEKPATEEELALVQSIVDCQWRIDRIGRLETSILLKGQNDCAKQYEDRPALERARLIEGEAYLKYEKQIRNLYLQESRLRRLLDKERKELAKLKADRRRQEQADSEAQRKAKTAPPARNGFDFSDPLNPSPTGQNKQPNDALIQPDNFQTARES